MCSAEGDQFKQKATEPKHYSTQKIPSLQCDLAVLGTQGEVLCDTDALNTWHALKFISSGRCNSNF